MSRINYAKSALEQIPRILGNLDRNAFSPTYGCFHRDYWLDKTSDFPDSVRQFSVHSLALIFENKFPDNIYYKSEKIKKWAIAAMKFWAKIQHKDGSFDEFYPFERGWVGPTAFTMYTICESYDILNHYMDFDSKEKVLYAIRKAAYFVGKGESEEDHLANHHAMACLSLWKAYKLLNDKKLFFAYEKALNVFLDYHYEDEGWSREYDGVDPGYLSATISFFAKIYKENKDPKIYNILKQSINFSKYFVYPNGYYAGSLGSRNTLHFYSHGYEVLGNKIPLAKAIARKLSSSLAENKLVPPAIISDRYVHYRIPEYLLSFLDSDETTPPIGLLPYEKKIKMKYFNRARIFIHSTEKYHVIANLIKGGVIKVFNKSDNSLIYNDCGIIAKLNNGSIITSQWVDENYKTTILKNGFEVEGYMNIVPSNKLFNPFKNIIFRTVMISTAWSPKIAHFIKGKIRKALILGQRRTRIKFKRSLKIGDKISIRNELENSGKHKFSSLRIGDEFFVRYVPQSRYFQAQELKINPWIASNEALESLNKNSKIVKEFNCN